MYCSACLLKPIALLAVVSLLIFCPHPARGNGIAIPNQAQRIMTLDEVQVGMKGYGITIFQGTKIEPFAVEVLSIVHDQAPKRAVIWIRCHHPRLEVSGPVQGMSGSPIYLWDTDEPKKLGQGGRLIGAFAYGYPWDKVCTAGVQPIELMRKVASRMTAAQEPPQPRSASTSEGLASLRRLRGIADRHETADSKRYPLDRIYELLVSANKPPPNPDTVRPTSHHRHRLLPPPNETGWQPLRLPIAVGSPLVAQFGMTMLEPLGLTTVVSTVGTIGSKPPAGLDTDLIQIRPGAVLSVPLVYGDLSLSGSGTVTDVLPDGTVLAFGHEMFGQGPTAVPMATGYVHFIASLATMSFRASGDLRIVGSLVQDEFSAVVGSSQIRFETAPMTVAVRLPNQPPRHYKYHVVDHPQITPVLTAIAALRSVSAVQELPRECTMRVKVQLAFEGNRTLEATGFAPNASAIDVVWAFVPPVTSMMQNPFQKLKLRSVQMDVEVKDSVQAATLIGARVDQAIVAPGTTVKLSFQIQPYGGPIQTHQAEVRVPLNTPEGNYPLLVSDAASYSTRMFATRPHLMSITTIDELHQTLNKILSIRTDVAHVMLQLAEKGIAVGRNEMPELPSSRRAMIATPTSTTATSFFETVHQVVNIDHALSGEIAFTIHVRKPDSELSVP